MEYFFALFCLISYLSSGSSQTEDPTPLPVLSQANPTQFLCRPVLSSHTCYSLPARNSVHQYPQRLPDDIVFSSMSIAVSFLFLDNVNPPADPDCISALKHITCIASAPPCSEETGLLLSICPNSCLAYNRVFAEGGCNSAFEYGRTLLAESDSMVIVLLFELLFQFNCSNTSSYIFYDNADSLIDPDACTDLYTDDDEGMILSRPNQCVPAPSTICDTTHERYYIPLHSRNDSSHLQPLATRLQLLVDENCTNLLLHLACFYRFPPCDPTTGNALPFCMDFCDRFSDLIEYCASLLTADTELVEFLRTFNCSNTDTYFPPFVLVDNNTCINDIQFGGERPHVPEGPVIAVSVIAGATVGALLFVILVTVLLIVGAIFLYWRRHTRSHDVNLSGYKLTVSLRKAGNVGTRRESVYTLEPDGQADKPQLKHNVKDSPLAEELMLSEADRLSYEKTFSSILVPYASLTVGEEIGQGAFGKVYRGEVRRSISDTKFEDIAIKTIKNLSSQNEVEAFFAESFVMKDFHHPNVLGLAGVCFDTPDGVPYILLPFMANGSLKDYLKKKRIHVTNVDTLPEDLSIAILVRMCLDIANGMQYLATMKFVHRDLAARNCMVNTDLAVKVGDFGLARDIYTADYYRANKEARLPVKWMPPETLHDGISNEKTDVWSYGVTCWEVFSLGRTPYPGVQNQDVLKHISSDQRLERPSLCPKLLYDMIMFQCWKLIPEDRPTFSELAHHATSRVLG